MNNMLGIEEFCGYLCFMVKALRNPASHKMNCQESPGQHADWQDMCYIFEVLTDSFCILS